MYFTGIDLAAEPKYTGAASVQDDGGILVVQTAAVGATDDQLVQATQDADMTGVDVPVGWPQAFVELIQAQAVGALQAPENTAAAWRRRLAMRTTDIELYRRTGLTPLSVSTNLIAYPALRWAGLEARLRDLGVDVSRDGNGAVAEVYPAAALHRWGLPYRGYKGPKNAAVRSAIVGAIPRLFPTLEWNGFDSIAGANDNVLDAVIAALIAHQIVQGHCEGPPPEHTAAARAEGWIWVPKGPAQE